jgi:hypothetical protein
MWYVLCTFSASIIHAMRILDLTRTDYAVVGAEFFSGRMDEGLAVRVQSEPPVCFSRAAERGLARYSTAITWHIRAPLAQPPAYGGQV